MLITHQSKQIEQYAQKLVNASNSENSLVNYPTLRRRVVEGMMITLFAAIGILLGPADDYGVPVWPHMGILLGFLYLRGIRILAWILLGQIIAFYYAKFDWQLNIALSLYQTFSLAILYHLSLKWIGPIVPLSLIKVWLKWFSWVLAVSSLICLGWIAIVTSLDSVIFLPTQVIRILICHSLSVVIFCPLCLIWDNVPNPNKSSRLHLVGMFLLVLITHFGFSLATSQFWLALSFSASLSLLVPACIMFGQMGVCWLSISLGLFLLTYIDMPSFELVAQHPNAIWIMQLTVLVSIFLSMTFATWHKEKRMRQTLML